MDLDVSWPIGRIITESARRFRDVPCWLATSGEQRTFAEVNARVNRICDALAERGVGKGTRIALLDTDSFAYAEVLLACFKLGATYVPVNFRLAQFEIENILGQAKPELFFVGGRYLDLARKVVPGLPRECALLSLDGCLDDDVESLAAAGRDIEPDVRLKDDDLLGIMFTSGTTGLPKGVMQTHGMLKRMLSLGWEVFARPRDVRYTASPLFHIAGWALVFEQVSVGCTSLIEPQFDPAVTAKAIADGLLTGCFLVPTMIQAVLDADTGPTGRERLDTMLYGSAPMPPSLLKRALERYPDCGFWNMFGAGTESGVQTLLRPEDHRRALAGEEHLLASAGQPVLYVDMRILDDAGNEVPAGVVGNIAARTDCVMAGYLDLPDKTREALHDGWFWGGDRGWVDEEGYLFLGGRSRDMIVRGGENIYVSEIELVLTDVPEVADAAVVGRPDERWGEVVVAFVEYRGEPPAAEDLERMCRARLAGYKVPVEYHILRELPRNPTGKVRKSDLLDLATS
ncbi:class I adenylate-forming enzyme family protein [Actinomadura sp. BRA 177]|uniref:class I adenylate-forming enzyme family protein n=1 Tax=Actinomadura sp. BRA 177 TaxID=2745202 RepID=UPI001594F808|nr:AMP-binding protein [Actinomadura sp. BRA 177]NVI89055.1 AMP-binding protein [Actinomadura sp. BRA 177]